MTLALLVNALGALQPMARWSPPDSALSTVTIGTSDLQQQSLPLSYVSSWPVWVASPDGRHLTRIPEESDDGWNNPTTFEQLWMPEDLRAPTCTGALGAVVKDGMVRYLFPSVEMTVASNGQRWHNRGLHSLPLAKTWLPFGEVPINSLRLSCYSQPLPDPDEVTEEGDEEGTSPATEPLEAVVPLPWTREWDQLKEVGHAFDKVFQVLADAPDDLGKGFHYLIVPLPEAPIATERFDPGQRVRLFLSDVDATPTKQWLIGIDEVEREEWVWNHGECDLRSYEAGAGRDSEFLPAVYKPLFFAGSSPPP